MSPFKVNGVVAVEEVSRMHLVKTMIRDRKRAVLAILPVAPVLAMSAIVGHARIRGATTTRAGSTLPYLETAEMLAPIFAVRADHDPARPTLSAAPPPKTLLPRGDFNAYPQDLYGLDYGQQMDAATAHFAEDRPRIAALAASTRRELKNRVLSPPSGRDVILGGVLVARQAGDSGDGNRSFEDFCARYRRWRQLGLSHQQVINKLHEQAEAEPRLAGHNLH